MATKKCPKCGEENPAEAVMCWACYTPLAGGAAAATGGGLVAPRGGPASVTPAATAAKEEKKSVDPKIFVVVGVLVVALVIGGFTTGVFGGSNEGGSLPEADPKSPAKAANSGPTKPPVGPVTSPINPSPITPSDQKTTQVVVEIPYRVLAPPNPRYTTGTIGIVANDPTIAGVRAGSLAKSAKRQFAPNGRWTKMQVLVFTNNDAARVFAKYQAKRDNVRLYPDDFQELANQGLWATVPAYYESNGNAESTDYPTRNPSDWWLRRKEFAVASQ